MRTGSPAHASAIAFALAIAAPAVASPMGQQADPGAAARAAILEALGGGAGAKLAVSEHFAKQHVWAHDAAAIGYDAPDDIPAEVAIADGTITFTFAAPAAIAGKRLRLVPADGGNGKVRWRCEAPELGPGIAPQACK
jgi:hypothetical protein